MVSLQPAVVSASSTSVEPERLVHETVAGYAVWDIYIWTLSMAQQAIVISIEAVAHTSSISIKIHISLLTQVFNTIVSNFYI